MKKLFALLTFLLFLEKNLYSAEAGMPQLDPEYWPSQIFWLIIIFFTIYILISKIFIPKIKGSIDMREDKIRKDLEEAKTFKEQAESKLKEYNDLMEKAKLDVKKILSESRNKLNEDMQIKRDEAQKKTDASMLLLLRSSPNISFTKFDVIFCEIKFILSKESFLNCLISVSAFKISASIFF